MGFRSRAPRSRGGYECWCRTQSIIIRTNAGSIPQPRSAASGPSPRYSVTAKCRSRDCCRPRSGLMRACRPNRLTVAVDGVVRLKRGARRFGWPTSGYWATATADARSVAGSRLIKAKTFTTERNPIGLLSRHRSARLPGGNYSLIGEEFRGSVSRAGRMDLRS
jgi:hypothetical protein